MKTRITLRSVFAAAAAAALGLTMIAADGPPAGGSAHGGDAIDCMACHSCPEPTADNPCLKMCPRHEAMAHLPPDLGPDIVILDELEDLYVPVRFAHRMHAQMSELDQGCETCHHYAGPDMEIQSCKECHPVEIVHEDIAQPGLKGAYHRQCMGCHTEWDKDTACEICHEKKEGGRLHGQAVTFNIHRHYEPVVINELITFDTEYDTGDQVPFYHKRHAEIYSGNCVDCHREQGCEQCHSHEGVPHPMGDLGEVDLHETCFQCHEDVDCEYCHGRDPQNMFAHEIAAGWPLQSYHHHVKCAECHVKGEFEKIDNRCEHCHAAEWEPEEFNHTVTGVALDEVHELASCMDCHLEGVGAKSSCATCHDDNRVYADSTGFSG